MLHSRDGTKVEYSFLCDAESVIQSLPELCSDFPNANCVCQLAHMNKDHHTGARIRYEKE